MANHQQFQACYQNWMAQQKLDHDELLQGLTNFPTDLDYLKLITRNAINHIENHHTARAQLAKHDGPSFLAPTWGTTFENSSLWIGGSRPSLIIRLVYVLCGSQLKAHLAEFLEGVRRGNLGEISSSQLKNIDSLHGRTIKEEDKLTSVLASAVADLENPQRGNISIKKGNEIEKTSIFPKFTLPSERHGRKGARGYPFYHSRSAPVERTYMEKVADEPLVLLAYNCKIVGESSQGETVDEAMDSHALEMYKILMEADKLRLDILKHMIDILTPLQAVELLVALKKLPLCLHEWSKRRDIQMGITQLLNTQISSTSGPPEPEP
ncbi:putative transcription factor TGA like domain-containing protein [Helianthus annuus]|nr:putative transcription factor TGA like domain-containing protein [Helianthus annuus]KAJ0601177.1 putative transcription factor TGA like domain-containing protein [Helianthus annuus]KAJ0608328.1 putative transcription factor TGA like domain-containing protein [Helianthus annuus]KAJ0768393.1 putative transcription factor TGA like domain-containing protein [Helianthus annuus]KAJ0774147.1 putative transcription factor TGA like domain-containing protein [Helianthus annuus]